METVQIAAIVVRTEKKNPFHVDSLQRRSTILLLQQTPTEENGHALHQHFNVQSN